jgi:NADPH:quinone reductase-like Zn-dependent oxidoreductase
MHGRYAVCLISMQARSGHVAAIAPFRLSSVPRPVPGRDQALVHTVATAVNPLDLKIRDGAAAHANHPLPAILGLDLAGTIEATGENVTWFHRGDEVYGLTGGVGGHQGSLAEFAAVDADLLALKPANVTMREAAALPLIFIIAWEGLIDRARCQAGQSVLVQGGSGGVGHMAIQIARAFGATVFATGAPSRRSIIERFGANFIDRSEPVADYATRLTGGRGFDIVYDTAGGATLDASFKAVSRFGHVVSCLGWDCHSLASLSFKGATYSGVFTLLPLLTGEGRTHHGDILAQATRLVEAGELVPLIDPRRFSLVSVESANNALRDGDARGKIIIDLAGAAHGEGSLDAREGT